jgi:hypothetical protein
MIPLLLISIFQNIKIIFLIKDYYNILRDYYNIFYEFEFYF